MNTEYQMTLPEHTTYKDVHIGMLDCVKFITMNSLSNYLWQFEKAMDKKKCAQMHEQRYIRNMRISESGSNLFVESMIWAEMKKM